MDLKLSLSFLIGLTTFIVGFPKPLKLAVGHERGPKQWHTLVKEDYRQLRSFPKDQNLFDIGEERFEELLLNGLTEALDFYQSPTNLNAAIVNQWIHAQFMTNPHLAHTLPAPQIVSTDKSRAFEALNNFKGFWHGKWKSEKVHHHWLPVREHYKKISGKVHLLGFQSCFTGDGIGWNYVVEKEDEILILGFVYHTDLDGSIVFGNPHYAYLNREHQLTWVSDNHMYYEFTCANAKCEFGKHYVITGGHYKNDHEKPHLVSGFQAVYLSKELELPQFEPLVLNPIEKREDRSWETWASSISDSFKSKIPTKGNTFEYVHRGYKSHFNPHYALELHHETGKHKESF